MEWPLDNIGPAVVESFSAQCVEEFGRIFGLVYICVYMKY